MKISNPQKLKLKEFIVFDLDGTLTESKSLMTPAFAVTFAQLLETRQVAVISGGDMKQFKIQFLDPLKKLKPNYQNLFLFPTTGTAFYQYKLVSWRKVYSHTLAKSEVRDIREAFAQAFREINYHHPQKTYGPVIENRGTQVTFSALGQQVVSVLGKRGVALKERWSTSQDVRPQMQKVLQKLLPQFKVRIAGLTSLDVTMAGIDKAYGIRQITKHLKIPIKKMLFVGDAIFKGGNDYEALKTGIDYVKVKGPAETQTLIDRLLK